jgi:hypothetical protein
MWSAVPQIYLTEYRITFMFKHVSQISFISQIISQITTALTYLNIIHRKITFVSQIYFTIYTNWSVLISTFHQWNTLCALRLSLWMEPRACSMLITIETHSSVFSVVLWHHLNVILQNCKLQICVSVGHVAMTAAVDNRIAMDGHC